VTRVAVVGAGGVGVSCATAILQQGLCSELAIYDRTANRARGEALDFLHAAPLLPESKVAGRPFDEFQPADIAVLAVGAHTEPGQTRLDLIDQNLEVAADAAAAIEQGGLPRVLIVVTSPLDVVTEYLTRRWEDRPVSVMGTGTSLDSWRLRERLAEEFGVHPGNVHAWVVGEHGDSAVFLFSSVTIGPFPLGEALRRFGVTLDAERLAAVEEEVRTASYQVRSLKGSTTHAIALATARIILHLTREPGYMIPVSLRVADDVCASLPAIIRPEGPGEPFRPPMSEGEGAAFEESLAVLREANERIPKAWSRR
jgi:L-lactate dehydrogenase